MAAQSAFGPLDGDDVDAPSDDFEGPDGGASEDDGAGFDPSPDGSPDEPSLLPPPADRDALEAPRSFLAHPDPLKWIVGGANSLRIVPCAPQDGQKCGPGSFRPRRMSTRWSHAEQAYS
jgi:hypothetical protein